MGRPTKLTPETQKKIVDAITAGNHLEAAAAYAGVEYRTFSYWMERGKTAKSGEFFQFFQAVMEAQARAEVTIVAQWKQQIPDNWQAARDFLARRYPERWAETHKVAVLVQRELEAALDTLQSKLAPEIYAQVLRALDGGSREEAAPGLIDE